MTHAGPVGDDARWALATERTIRVPFNFGAEVTSAVRRLLFAEAIDARTAEDALDYVRTVRARRYRFERFIDRTWELRDNITVYDAWYVSLSESLGTALVTADQRLVEAPGPRCPVMTPATFLADRR